MLQVGHIERFSSAYRTLAKMMTDPLYFESYRIAPWKNRGVEVDVVLDLMIHDIDMIIGLVELAGRERRCGRHAGARPQMIDLANARITFASGCVANVTASRVSYKTERRMRVFGRSHYLNCDLGEGQDLRLSAARRPDDRGAGGDRHRDATRSRSRTASPTRSTPFSIASSTAPSRWSTAAPAARRCAWRA